MDNIVVSTILSQTNMWGLIWLIELSVLIWSIKWVKVPNLNPTPYYLESADQLV